MSAVHFIQGAAATHNLLWRIDKNKLREHASSRHRAAARAATLPLISLVEGVSLGLRRMERAPCAFPAGRMD